MLDQLSAALGVELSAAPYLADQRLTLRSTKTTLLGLQQALAAMYGTGWRADGTGEETEYVLEDNAGLRSRAETVRQQRNAALVNGVLSTAASLRRRDSEAVAASLRQDLARRRPDLPAASLDALTPAYVNQALLAAPLAGPRAGLLTRSGTAWAPFYRLSGGAQQLLAGFVLERAGASEAVSLDEESPRVSTAAGGMDPLALNSPRARVEYRIAYGDRWSGPLLVTRVGVGRDWATAALPSVLYRMPDYAALYPQAAEKPVARELFSRVEVRLDLGTLTRDQALTALARAAKINVLADSLSRPELFRPADPAPVVTAGTLEEVLDRLAAYYQAFWWKEGEWYVFRSRQWADEERATPPAALMKRLGGTVARAGRLRPEELALLPRLTDEQVTTLMLQAVAVRGTVLADALDVNRVQALRAGLTLLAQLTPQQREQARTRGVPYTQMSAAQQAIFSGVAADLGYPREPSEQYRWRFRVSDSFDADPGSGIRGGRVRLVFDGQSWRFDGELPLRLPASPSSPTPAAAPPAGTGADPS